MDYIKSNKLAWEEAFEHRRPNWGGKNHEILKSQALPFLNADTVAAVKEIGLRGKSIAQFCCNNGRELLSLTQLKPSYAAGFDIAENFIAQARETAEKAGIGDYEFVACDILEIDGKYHGRFDFIFFTIGAITWFKDLGLLFAKVSKCLKPGGKMLINDFHPFMGMLAFPGEKPYDAENIDKLAYSYFRKEPWIENSGMSYITPEYESKTFTSFSHTLGSIISSAARCGMPTIKLCEYDYDVGLTDAYNGKGYPLSFILVTEKWG